MTWTGPADDDPIDMIPDTFDIDHLSGDSSLLSRLDLDDGTIDGTYYDLPVRIGVIEHNDCQHLIQIDLQEDIDHGGPLLDSDRRSLSSPEEAVRHGCVMVRRLIMSSVDESIVSCASKALDRDHDIERIEDNVRDVSSPRVYGHFSLSTLMTEHQVVGGYDFETSSYLLRAKFEGNQRAKGFDANVLQDATIDFVYGIRDYFRQAKQ